MKRILISIALLACLISGYAHAVTYTYTGQNYTYVEPPYTTDMKVTGSFTTSTPIPPNSSDYDFSAILTSWSLNDGLQTIDNTNGVFSPNRPPSVTTDDTGTITTIRFWGFTPPVSTIVGDTDSYIRLNPPRSIAASGGSQDIDCTFLNNGFCWGWGSTGITAFTRDEGVWVTSDLPSTPIPTMTQWSLMLLALMLGLVGIARIRRQV